ncbi:hypothetical protein [Mycolicibacter virginiensis]|uniref:hypothetical protein n=1 Tax=Mycolicibacter virginiensis TaxID=1795032 RepID=UPI001F04A8B4|nr:hypothetical protein [Mycolicibacter virginiensis]ULP48048.1 hypothetical protein MJO54_02430 [Mycolicibacter virginiensis]
MPDTANLYREDIANFFRRAECHFGHTLREEEAGLTVEEAAEKRNIGAAQVRSCRRGVHNALGGEFTTSKAQARYDEAVYRALLHFRGEMTDGLRHHIDMQLRRFKAEYFPGLKMEPLDCDYASGIPLKANASQRREPDVCPECWQAHAGECQ